MEILTDLDQATPEPSCLTIGYFDGVHRGHRYLINQASATARRQGLRAVVLTFYPHPTVVLRGAQPFYLSTREEKLTLLSESGLDLTIIQPFTPGLAQTRASQYVDWLIERVGMVNLWVGPDFALGYRREGNVDFLQQKGVERDFKVNVVERLKLEHSVITSSRIGRPYRLQGSMVIGAQQSRTIGFPTANIEVPAERAVPANGVYAAWAILGSNRHRAVVNIGTRPTFDNGPRTIEAHLLDFSRDTFGRRLTLDFIAHLRPEQRFKSTAALVTQINRDMEQARQLLHAVDVA
jgi:riboflavin kinase/FMN adenylyltransferase